MKKVILIFLLAYTALASAQQQNLPLNREFNLTNQKAFQVTGSSTHTSFQPVIQSQIHVNADSVLSDTEKEHYMINLNKSYHKDRSWLIRKLLYENFLIVDTNDFYLTVDPLLNGELGKDSEDKSGRTLYKNTRGIMIRANVGEKFSFETSVYENQIVAAPYLDNYITSKEAYRVVGIVPGQGRVKTFKKNGYDFSSSSAVLTYAPAKFLALQMGTGKHFIGDGYRSLLLSDYSFNYPFFRAMATFGKRNQFQYSQLNASISSIVRRDLTATPEALFVRKSMTTHYFNWMATKWLDIGLFEMTMWHTEDSTGTKPYEFQQLNPIIGINALTTATDKAHHSNVGANLKIKLPANTIVYGQFLMDGNQYEKTTGIQAGARFQGIKGLTLQAEYNAMNNPYNNYFEPELEAFTNYNEPIAHPLGDHFQEVIGILNYQYKRAFAEYKLGIREVSNVKSLVAQGHLGYMINPKNNLAAMIGFTERVAASKKETMYVYFGIRTNLRNLYDDF
ncbi:MAG: hypothetical protein KDD41_12025 [Flavobacteriales bacterium]|nr:hypothetical protein [Flavobacteriales bacterium]